MEETRQAFFVDYKYYLLPDDCFSVEDVKRKTVFKAKRLKEERCMAPDFIYESVVEEEVFLESGDRVFPVEVTLRSSAEYDEILAKRVDRTCHGCANYTDDGTSDLDGHHREMSLDGTCYLRREEEEEWSLSLCTMVFWYNVSQKLDELAECIDKNNQKKLNAILSKELSNFCPPFEFYGLVYEGKYTLCISCNYMPSMQSVVAMFAQTANGEGSEMKQAGWQVLAGKTKGLCPYRGKLKESSMVASVSAAEQPNRLILSVYSEKADTMSQKKRDAFVSDVVDYLIAALGEDVFTGVVSEVELTSDAEQSGRLGDVVKAFEEKERMVREEMGDFPYPMPVFYSVNREEGEIPRMLPYKEKIEEGSTTAPEASFLFREEYEEEKPFWLKLFGYAYLYIPKEANGVGNAMEALSWYLFNTEQIPQPLRDPEDPLVSSMRCGLAFSEDGFFIEFLVFDEKRFFRLLRILAPVLSAYRAKVVVVNDESVMAYDCGYTFEPIDGV